MYRSIIVTSAARIVTQPKAKVKKYLGFEDGEATLVLACTHNVRMGLSHTTPHTIYIVSQAYTPHYTALHHSTCLCRLYSSSTYL